MTGQSAFVECLDSDGYALDLIVVSCERSSFGDTGFAACDVPIGPDGTASRIVYLPWCSGKGMCALPSGDPEFGVRSTWIKDNRERTREEWLFPENYLFAAMGINGRRIGLDLARGSGWQRPENIGKYEIVA